MGQFGLLLLGSSLVANVWSLVMDEKARSDLALDGHLVVGAVGLLLSLAVVLFESRSGDVGLGSYVLLGVSAVYLGANVVRRLLMRWVKGLVNGMSA